MMRWRTVVLILAFWMKLSAGELARFVVVLNDAPLAEKGDRELILRSQASVRAQLRPRHIESSGETHTLLNALFIWAEPEQVAELRTIPGVRYVAREPQFHLSLDRAEQLINVPAAWNLINGGMTNAGAGIRIGVIDTGIQSSHAAFQDGALKPPPGYPLCSIYLSPLVPVDCKAFTNNKVIVARSYVATVAAGSGTNPAASSRPDDLSPRDHVGHGTAVAMAAAGVTNGSATATITGVAPKAFLGSYKVFGSPGVTDSTTGQAVIQALTDALADGMDIAVLSLGGIALSGPEDAGAICGQSNNGACDPWAAAVKNAANAGMLVVVAAGNEGPHFGTVDTPGTAPAALTAGASTNSHSWANPLTINGLGVFHSLLGGGPAPVASVNAPLSDVASVGDGEGCSPLPSGSLAGTYALVRRGTCTFAVKIQNLQGAGALGGIITNSAGDNSVLSPAGLSGVSAIPAALIGYDDGQAIRNYLKNSARAMASLGAALQAFEVTNANQVALFSSRGPVLGNGGIKPDVTAAGTDLFLPGQDYDPNGALYTPNGYLISQGTSFSTPQIAGIAALVKQNHPGWTVQQVKSAIVNTATQDVTDNGAAASVLAVGAGKANAAPALMSNLAASPVSASFGILTASKQPPGQPIQLTNTGTTALNLSLTLTRRTPENRARTAIDRPNLTLAPGEFTTVNLTLTGSLPDPGIYEGFLTVQGAAVPLQIPYLYVVGDGVPANIVPLLGADDDGIAGQSPSVGLLVLQLSDRYGVPVPNAPVRFNVTAGGGSVQVLTFSTDVYGFGAAFVTLGPDPGVNRVTATAGGLETTFQTTARLQPAISTKGIVDAASFTPGNAVSPGSLVAIFGTGLADSSGVETTPYLPLSIHNVSVSFDSGAVSAAGHLHFVTPGQVNAQVPWEMQGQSTAQVKVSVQSTQSSLYTLPLAPYSPGMFEIPAGGGLSAAARDENFDVISSANPAKPGHFIQLYCNGLGRVTNQPASGDPSPVQPLSATIASPTVTIGGRNAQVLFSGLTPTAVGLYQLNVVVPDGVSGQVPVVISIGGVTSKSSLIAVQ